MASNLDVPLLSCPTCTCQNGYLAVVCEACGMILPDAYNPSQSRWMCGECTLSNPDTLYSCVACSTPRHPVPSPHPTQPADPTPPANSALTTTPALVPTPPASARPSTSHPSRKGFNRQNSSLSHINRSRHLERLSLKVEDVVKFCTESSTKFEDPEFPASKSSIFPDNSTLPPLEGNAEVTSWLRPKDIYVGGKYRKLNWSLFNKPTSTDIKQGVLGNCWFASSLSVLAENRSLLEKIFVTKEYNASGVYAMRLCKDGQWIDVIVDDRLPCLRDGSLAFCKGKRKQLWVPLIEKALAKVFGSYGSLIAGTTLEGLSILTGFPCESHDFESLKRAGDLQPGEGRDLLWAKLLSSIESKFLLGCSCGKKFVNKEEEFTKVGLVSNHAYSILDVQLVHGERLLHLRNTWGKFSWTGDWSEYSECWNVVPAEVKSRLRTKGSDEGLFWISFDDWLTYFSAVYICFVRDGWHETRVRGNFLNGHSSHITISQLCILERTEMDLSLHQQSSRGDRVHDIVDLLLLVYDAHWRLVTHSRRVLRDHTTCSAILEPGYYNIYCLSFTKWLSIDLVEYTLVCHSHQPVYIEQTNFPKEIAVEALIHLALTEGVAAVCDEEGAMCTYSLNKGWSGQLTLAVNNHPSKYLHVKSDLTESVNVVSIRGLTTMDIVPPLHRQVLNISTHLEITASFGLRCKQSFLSSKVPIPGRWGGSAAHTPAITSQTHSIHRPVPFLYS